MRVVGGVLTPKKRVVRYQLLEVRLCLHTTKAKPDAVGVKFISREEVREKSKSKT